MTKARVLADFISDGSPLADGAVDVSEVSGAAPLANPTFTGTASGTFSGPLTGDVAGELDLSPIAATIADTAVDVFVYDTSKDSDGGAWRKRTQHTSWYNETLNTATRGSRKEFPSVAVIVAESNQVTIYDGDDPALPMWMVFNGLGTGIADANYALLISSSFPATSVSMLNGSLCVTGYYIHRFNFASEDQVLWGSAGFERLVPILDRNTAVKYVSNSNLNSIVSPNCNDVAMTVLPNAPIDAATGLPVPTIAVATDGGVSVIKDDGTVVDSASTSVYYSVMFNGSDLYAEDTTFADDTQYYGDAGSLSDSFPTFRNLYSYSPTYERLSSSTLSKFSGNILTPLGEPRSFAVGLAADTASSASWTALNMVADHSGQNGFATRTALVSYINSSFNTGWMNGDIKLATLSDTDDTDVTGTDYFSSIADGDWTLGPGATVSSGDLAFSSAAGSQDSSFATTAPVGSTLVVEFTVANAVAGAVGLYLTGDSGGGVQAYRGANGTYSETFSITSANQRVRFRTNSTTTLDVTNISVRLAEEDRSVNGNGLQVFGTVSKTPVASGADLVAYSFSGDNTRLLQPYNSDLDFGTGDFCYTWWMKAGGVSSYQGIFTRGTGKIEMIYTSSEQLSVRVGSSNQMISSSLPLDVWNHCLVVRINGVVYTYLNGKLDTLNSSAGTQTVNTTGTLTVGNRESELTREFTGSLALLRASATAPSPEQIAKIYEDEKVLFQENAQATLYGSSDAVTALAYDDSTELLHVGTSAGRSDFQGLRRVNNTTNAVGAAISASNGMIVEE